LEKLKKDVKLVALLTLAKFSSPVKFGEIREI